MALNNVEGTVSQETGSERGVNSGWIERRDEGRVNSRLQHTVGMTFDVVNPTTRKIKEVKGAELHLR